MADISPLQSALPTCKDHLNEELDTYCYTCCRRVCEKCCQGTHMTHKWSRSKTVAREVRQNTEARCEELEEMMHELDIDEKEEDMDTDKIEKLRTKWITAINKSADMLKAKRRAGKSKETVDKRKYLKKMLEFFREEIYEADDTVVVEMEEEFHIKKEQLSQEKKLVFKEGTFSPDVMQQMVGDVVEDQTQSNVQTAAKSSEYMKNAQCLKYIRLQEANSEKYLPFGLCSADDTVVVEMEEEFHIKKEQLSQEKKLVFKEGTFSPDVMQQMVGDVVEDQTQSNVQVTERSHFTHIDDSQFISCIVPLTSNEALIRRNEDTYIDHIDITGKVIKKLQIDTGDFIMMDDDIVGTDFSGKKIQRFSSSGTVSDVCSTAPLHPTGICESHDGSMLVCLCDCDSDEITSDSRGEVHHIDSSGRIIRRYGHTEDQKIRLFINPNTVSQNINMDLCVVDNTAKEFRSRLVILTVTSKIKSIYTGQAALKKKFSSDDVCCDNHGRIMVTDLHNHAVHLLDEDGKFLQYILTKQSPLYGPRSLGLHGESLCVGCNNGVVRVYKYNNN